MTSALSITASPLHAEQTASTLMAAQSLAEGREQSIECLTTAIVYEAATEPLEGQQAVAQVIMNRTRSALYPSKVCGVIYQGSNRRTGCQFTFTCDGSLRRRMPVGYFTAARIVAATALDGTLPDRVGSALFYHANYVLPRWAPRLDRVGQIGAHVFYRQPGGGARTSSSVREPSGGAEPIAEPKAFAPWGLPMPMVAMR